MAGRWAASQESASSRGVGDVMRCTLRGVRRPVPGGVRPVYGRAMATGKRFRAAVIGGSGYGGAELIRRLLLHPDVELVRVASVDFVGEPLSAADPALEQLTDLTFQGIPPAEAARGVDVVLLGLPHTVAAKVVPDLVAIPGLKVVDMSGDFRLKDVAAYEKHYKHVHPCPQLMKDFVYGLPELFRARVPKARLVANPGCYPTAVG